MPKPTGRLDFEKPIDALQVEIDALTMLPRTPARHQELQRLRARVTAMRQEIFASLTPGQRVQISGHPDRPRMRYYIDRLASDFTEIHGDRHAGDDAALIAGFGRVGRRAVLLLGQNKGQGEAAARHRLGAMLPEGYRKAERALRLAEKFGRPVVAFVDTPSPHPGVEAETHGIGAAVAATSRTLAMLRVPTVSVLIGEGGGAGALALGIADKILMQEYASYSVVPPETAAAVLWQDRARGDDATAALRITASDLVALGVVDQAIAEPIGGAHADPDQAARLLRAALEDALESLGKGPGATRVEERHSRFRLMGLAGPPTAGDAPFDFLPGER